VTTQQGKSVDLALKLDNRIKKEQQFMMYFLWAKSYKFISAENCSYFHCSKI
jgi:hypothetical protein